MGSRKSPTASVIQVRNQNFFIDNGPKLPRAHEVNTVKVRDGDNTLIRWGVILIVLVHIECKQNHVNTVKFLENNYALRAVRKLIWEILVSLAHQFPDFMLIVHRRHLSNDDRALTIELFECFLERYVLETGPPR